MSALQSAAPPSARAPDDVVSEVAGAAFTPVETASAISIGVMALLMAGLMPLLLGGLAAEGRLSASGIGLAAMVEALSTGLVTGLAGIVLKPVRLRIVAAAASLVLVAVDLATVRASGGGVLLIRAVAGLPEGLLLWIAIGLISRTAKPERWAAVLFLGMGISQLVASAGLSALVLPRFGANGGYVALGLAALTGLPLALFAPGSLGATTETGESVSGAPPLKGWVALFGTLCMAASIAAVSVYVLPLARQAGLSVGVGRTAVTAALALQMVGGALSTWLAGRVRYIAVFFVCGATFLAAWAVFAVHAPAWLFILMSGLTGVATMLAGPFLVPMTIEADPSRRAAMQSGAVQLLAGAFGPLLASFVVNDRNVHGALALGAGLQLVGLALAVALHLSNRRGEPAA